MRTVFLMLCGPLLRMLLRNVVADYATANRANNGMMARVVTCHAAHHGALQAAGGIGGSGCRESQCGSRSKHGNSVFKVHDLRSCDFGAPLPDQLSQRP